MNTVETMQLLYPLKINLQPVSRKKQLLEKRNQKIYNRYKELYDVKFLRHERVLEILSEEYYLLPAMLGRIITSSKKANKTIIEKLNK